MINSDYSYNNLKRRNFIKNTLATAGLVIAGPVISKASGYLNSNSTFTVKQIINSFISEVPGGAIANTVDTLKAGSQDTVVTGIVTTMFATIDIIKKAISLGANFIIVHEPTYYNHADETNWLQKDDVFKFKMDLLNKHQIAVWRNHDYIHHLNPDGVTMGVLNQLEWQKYSDKSIPNLVNMPDITLNALILQIKEKLNIERVRYIGSIDQSCSRILFLPGAAGGQNQIAAISKYKPDVIICGEISEWETAEYVRDAKEVGQNIALVVVGHIASEEPGSEYMAAWLHDKFPAVKTQHLSAGNSLRFL